MEQYTNTPNTDKDPVLWIVAQKRASFKYHLVAYIVMNIFFWTIWVMTGARYTSSGLPWPVWPAFGWGIGLLFHFFGAYVYPKSNQAEKEYDNLMRNKR